MFTPLWASDEAIKLSNTLCYKHMFQYLEELTIQNETYGRSVLDCRRMSRIRWEHDVQLPALKYQKNTTLLRHRSLR